MITAIIFDWIGTLYERNKCPFPDSLETLKALKEGRIKMSLVSLTNNPKERIKQISDSGLSEYFNQIVVDANKTDQQYFMCMHLMQTTNRETAIVDDRMIRGIKIGNSLNCQTFWIRRGEYAKELPNQETGEPKYTIDTAKDILPYIL